MMQTIEAVEQLESLYGEASTKSMTKVAFHLTPLYKTWIETARFTVLSTVGSDGTDASPRGDSGPVVKVIDDKTIWLPDWKGNNRLDSLRNIVTDGRVSMMFMIPGSNNVVRVNGNAVLTADAQVLTKFTKDTRLPKTVIVVRVKEVYFQCAKALMRSELWASASPVQGIPSAGEFLREMEPGFDSDSYDEGYEDSAKDRMW